MGIIRIEDMEFYAFHGHFREEQIVGNKFLIDIEIETDLDPAGIGARTLQECLLLQLNRKVQTNYVKLATLILTKYFDEFTRKHYDKITKKAHISEEDLKKSVDEILKLNPKPGGSLGDSGKGNHYIMPDFIITNKEGILDLQLNSKNTPELRLSRTYTEMLETYADSKSKSSAQKDALTFIKQKIDSAKWFIDAIKQRQNTLFLTMNAIMKYQKEYFLTGDETKLRPMILKDIATIIKMDAFGVVIHHRAAVQGQRALIAIHTDALIVPHHTTV